MNSDVTLESIIYCGIDICKENLDIYCKGKHKRILSVKLGVKKINSDFKNAANNLLLFYESTGYPPKRVQHWARELDIKQVCVNPSRIRNFARSKGDLAKLAASDFACSLDDNLRRLGAHSELCKPKKL